MIVSSQVHLVDGPILFAPLRELDKAILLRYIRYCTDDGVP